MACSKFHTEDPQILGTTAQNSVAQVTWHAGFVHPWAKKVYSSVGFYGPFKLRHVTLEQEQHQPGHHDAR